MRISTPSGEDSPTFEVRPIGVVRRGPYADPDEAPHQGWHAPDEIFEIEVFEPFRAGLGDLARVNHIHVLLWFHRANRDSLTAHPPHLDGATLPVFWSRSPNRPNPIGLDTVEVVSICDGVITVRGMDALVGTPVIDIKPHIPSLDCPTGALDMLRVDG